MRRRGIGSSDRFLQNTSFIEAMLEIFSTLLGQEFMIKKPRVGSFRIMMSAWYLFAIIICTGYKSNLISYMTLPNIPARMETLSEIIESGARLEINIRRHLKLVRTS